MDEAIVFFDDRRTFFQQADSRSRDMAVNTGSHYAYTDASGLVWEADRAHVAGSWGRIGDGHPQLMHHRIFGTDQHALYQASLDSAVAYRFDVPDGEYDVRLRFAESVHELPGQRVFDVRVNGTPIATALDLVAAYGRYVAVERVVVASVRGGRGVEVSLQARVGATTISGIHLRRR